MKQQVTIENILFTLLEEGSAIRVTSPDHNVLLASQNIENVILIIETNFRIVDSFYLKRIGQNESTTFMLDDIHRFSVSIVLRHLHIHNGFRLQYTRKKYQDMGFKQEDFESPSTNDIIFRYYEKAYPNDWEIKCSVLMAMELDELRRYYERRLQYYNK